MFNNIKDKIFPCQQRLRNLINEREIACKNNAEAHEKLSEACIKKPKGAIMVKYGNSEFPELKENHIVNPSKINPNSNF